MFSKIVVHAVGEASESCQTFNCTQAGPGNDCAPDKCATGILYQRVINTLNSTFMAACTNSILNNGSWSAGSTTDKNASGQNAFIRC